MKGAVVGDLYRRLMAEPASIKEAISDYLWTLHSVPGCPWAAEYDIAKLRIADALLRQLSLPIAPITEPLDEALGDFRREVVPYAMRETVLSRDRYRCRSCGSSNDLTIDHITPVALGGLSELPNLQTLCRSCNSRKGLRL